MSSNSNANNSPAAPAPAADAPEVVDAPAETAPVADAPVVEQEAPLTYFSLLSSDDKKLKISKKAIKHSKTLWDLVEVMNMEDATPEEADKADPLPVPKLDGKILQLVVDWCEKHRDEEPKKEIGDDEPRNVQLPGWDDAWFKVLDNETLFELICGSNFLNVQLLLDYGCKVVANMAKGKSPAEMREIFGILSDEEEEELARNAAALNVNADGQQPGPSNA